MINIEIILAVIIGSLIFVSNAVYFSLGIKYGLSIKNGSQPKIEPFKPIADKIHTKKAEKEDKEQENAFKNLMSYKGEAKI